MDIDPRQCDDKAAVVTKELTALSASDLSRSPSCTILLTLLLAPSPHRSSAASEAAAPEAAAAATG